MLFSSQEHLVAHVNVLFPILILVVYMKISLFFYDY